MKRSILMITVMMLAPCLAHAEHTRITNPNALSVEFLGRGVFYSFDYDRVMNDDLAAGFGFGSMSLKGETSVGVIPVYVNYYFTRDQGSLFATGGVAILTQNVSNSTSSFGSIETSPVLPEFGIGYENRTDSGFLFRMAAYGIIGGGSVSPWAGFTFGYAF